MQDQRELMMALIKAQMAQPNKMPRNAPRKVYENGEMPRSTEELAAALMNAFDGSYGEFDGMGRDQLLKNY